MRVNMKISTGMAARTGITFLYDPTQVLLKVANGIQKGKNLGAVIRKDSVTCACRIPVLVANVQVEPGVINLYE